MDTWEKVSWNQFFQELLFIRPQANNGQFCCWINHWWHCTLLRVSQQQYFVRRQKLWGQKNAESYTRAVSCAATSDMSPGVLENQGRMGFSISNLHNILAVFHVSCKSRKWGESHNFSFTTCYCLTQTYSFIALLLTELNGRCVVIYSFSFWRISRSIITLRRCIIFTLRYFIKVDNTAIIFMIHIGPEK